MLEVTHTKAVWTPNEQDSEPLLLEEREEEVFWRPGMLLVLIVVTERAKKISNV